MGDPSSSLPSPVSTTGGSAKSVMTMSTAACQTEPNGVGEALVPNIGDANLTKNVKPVEREVDKRELLDALQSSVVVWIRVNMNNCDYWPTFLIQVLLLFDLARDICHAIRRDSL